MLEACLLAALTLPQNPTPPTFADDVEFLRQHADVVLLEPEGGGAIAVSPRLSGRVMTSAFAPGEPGFGLVNRDSILAGPPARGFANYGGEDRLWLAPEGGPYALYFDPGAAQVLDNWFVPAAMDGGSRTVAVQSGCSITFRDRVELQNAAGATLRLDVERHVEALPRAEVEAALGRALPAGVECLAFRTVNRISWTGQRPVPHDRGLVSVWILGQFNPSPPQAGDGWEGVTRVLVPFRGGAEAVHKDYFGVVPPERLEIRMRTGGGTARFRADSALRSKIGVSAAAATGWLGAWQPSPPALTLVHHDVAAADAPVPDCRWVDPNPDAAKGDVATSYNNGGPPRFFELESLSAALPADPSASVEHVHATIHLRGAAAGLDEVARAFLGVERLD